MEYYILLPGDKIENIDFDAHKLGEKSFNVFWSGEGLHALMNLSKKSPDKLKDVRIIDSKKGEHTVEEFLKIIDRLEIRV
jgi:hypothetical protein